VPPNARRRLAVSSEEVVKMIVQEEATHLKTKQPIPKASLRAFVCIAPLNLLTQRRIGSSHVYARIELAIGTHLFDFVLACSLCLTFRMAHTAVCVFRRDCSKVARTSAQASSYAISTMTAEPGIFGCCTC
jgi:hypothetical protein